MTVPPAVTTAAENPHPTAPGAAAEMTISATTATADQMVMPTKVHAPAAARPAAGPIGAGEMGVATGRG